MVKVATGAADGARVTVLDERPALEGDGTAPPVRHRHAAPSSGTVLPGAPTGRAWWRPRVVAAAAAVTVAAVLAGVLVAARPAQAQVLVTVDGVPRTVTTDAGTVGELLAAQGIGTGQRDVVTPDRSTPVSDAPTVTVAYARPVALTVDGATTSVWTTAPDVRGLLAAEGLPEASATEPAPLAALPRAQSAVVVRTPKPITVQVDGATVHLVTTAPTVRAALGVPDVGLAPGDTLSVPGDAAVTAGATYRVTRVESDVQVHRQVLGATTTWVDDPGLAVGETQVRRTGADGLRVREVRVRYENGRVVARRVVSDHRTAPVAWVIARGTAPATSGSDTTITYEDHWTPATGKVDGEPDFAALAKCESGGNPRAVSPTGKYRGLYQFDLTTWHGVGGTGDPIDATPEEQTKRARILYDDRGRAPWPYCGRYL